MDTYLYLSRVGTSGRIEASSFGQAAREIHHLAGFGGYRFSFTEYARPIRHRIVRPYVGALADYALVRREDLIQLPLTTLQDLHAPEGQS